MFVLCFLRSKQQHSALCTRSSNTSKRAWSVCSVRGGKVFEKAVAPSQTHRYILEIRIVHTERTQSSKMAPWCEHKAHSAKDTKNYTRQCPHRSTELQIKTNMNKERRRSLSGWLDESVGWIGHPTRSRGSIHRALYPRENLPDDNLWASG